MVALPARYDAMCRAIAAAYRVDEVKDIRDKALALEIYAKQAKNTKAEQDACEIRLRAERKAGQLLAKQEKAKRGAGPGRGKVGHSARPTFSDTQTLSDLGISKTQSSKWQKLGAIEDGEFERVLKQGKPTTNGLIRQTEEPKQKPVAAEALWLWGRLREFVERNLLDRDPADVILTMTPEMLDDVHRLAPIVAAWLKRIGGVNAKIE